VLICSKVEFQGDPTMKHLSPLLLALALLPACDSSSSSGGDDDSDTGADSDTDMDVDTDSDSHPHIDGGCPGPIEGPCEFSFAPPPEVLLDSEEAVAFLGVEATRFESMTSFTSGTSESNLAAVLVSVLEADEYSGVAVVLIDLDAYAHSDEMVLSATVGTGVDAGLEPRALVHPMMEEHAAAWDVLVVLCPGEFDCSLYGMPVQTVGVGELELVAEAAVPEASAPVGFAAFGAQYALFGESIWHSTSLDAWEPGAGIADGGPIADVSSYGGYEVQSAVAVGAAGRVLRWNGASWSELTAVTESDLNSVAGWSNSSSAWFFAGGDDGVLVDDTTGELRACAVMDADITAVDGWEAKSLVAVGAADGSVSYRIYGDWSCLIMSGEQPVLDVSQHYLGGGILLILMLTADALTVQRLWVPEE